MLRQLGRRKLDSWKVNSLISDLERAMNYLDRGETTFRMPVDRAVRIANVSLHQQGGFYLFHLHLLQKGHLPHQV